ncbi:hypothetical protein COCNU_scaffold001656G000020 [Cocos nucifera]|nr:hypothetical protein [Cocos nucifera]
MGPYLMYQIQTLIDPGFRDPKLRKRETERKTDRLREEGPIARRPSVRETESERGEGGGLASPPLPTREEERGPASLPSLGGRGSDLADEEDRESERGREGFSLATVVGERDRERKRGREGV